MATQTEAATGESTMTDDEKTSAALMAEFTAEELRRLAAHLPDVGRTRGATKAETAAEITEQTEADLAAMMGAGSFSVNCSCGLRMSCGHPQTARSEAKAHKSRCPTHFPRARDENDNSRLYG